MPANHKAATGRRRCRSWPLPFIYSRKPWLTFKQGGLNNTKPVTTGEANGVGELLMQSGHFSGDRATLVQGGQEEGAYQLKFVINPSRVAYL